MGRATNEGTLHFPVLRKDHISSENHSPHKIRKRAILVPGTIKLLHHEDKNNINGDQKGCRLDLKPALDGSQYINF